MTPNWRDLAECRHYPLDLFFPTRGSDLAQAKAVCETCPVAAECLQYALDEHIEWGVWGGTSERQRRKLRRELRLAAPVQPDDAACGTNAGYRRHQRAGEQACDPCLAARREANARSVARYQQRLVRQRALASGRAEACPVCGELVTGSLGLASHYGRMHQAVAS